MKNENNIIPQSDQHNVVTTPIFMQRFTGSLEAVLEQKSEVEASSVLQSLK